MMHTKVAISLLACALATLAFMTAAEAQVSVNTASVEKKAYSSPMTLDVNFNLAHRSLWKAGRVSPKDPLSSFVCDGIYIDGFGMEGKGSGSGDKEKLEATLYYTLNAENGAPKRKVEATFQLFDGDTAISEKVKGSPVKLKDNDSEKQKVRIVVPASKLETNPLTMLRVTLTVSK